MAKKHARTSKSGADDRLQDPEKNPESLTQETSQAAEEEAAAPVEDDENTRLRRQLSELEERIAELERDLSEAQDGMLRAVADLQNYRRRAIQEFQQERERAAAEIAAKLLPVLDNLERTLEAAEGGASSKSVLEGVKLTDRELRSVLEEHRVRPIPALGMPFDPTLHEAVGATASDQEEGTILEELERGYRFGEKVLRPTKVKISKGPKK